MKCFVPHGGRCMTRTHAKNPSVHIIIADAELQSKMQYDPAEVQRCAAVRSKF